MLSPFFSLENETGVWVLRLRSADRTNRFSRECVLALTGIALKLSRDTRPLVITGTPDFFSAGADLREIAALSAPAAYEFSKLGQEWMYEVEQFPAPVFAAICGYCMGGGLDLALACHSRIAAPNAVFGHRGAALGLLTGWGGTQRLPRLVGKAKALEMFSAASKIDAALALRIGLVEAVVVDPVSDALHRAHAFLSRGPEDPSGGR